jgi:hypothetical protein
MVRLELKSLPHQIHGNAQHQKYLKMPMITTNNFEFDFKHIG